VSSSVCNGSVGSCHYAKGDRLRVGVTVLLVVCQSGEILPKAGALVVRYRYTI